MLLRNYSLYKMESDYLWRSFPKLLMDQTFPMLFKLFQYRKRDGKLPRLFYEANINPTPKPTEIGEKEMQAHFT